MLKIVSDTMPCLETTFKMWYQAKCIEFWSYCQLPAHLTRLGRPWWTPGFVLMGLYWGSNLNRMTVILTLIDWINLPISNKLMDVNQYLSPGSKYWGGGGGGEGRWLSLLCLSLSLLRDCCCYLLASIKDTCRPKLKSRTYLIISNDNRNNNNNKHHCQA